MTQTAPRTGPRSAADLAYRRAWWSLALFPVTFVGAFVVGEGLLSMLDDGVGDPAWWVVLASGGPALLLFVVPGVLAVALGRRAVRLGRPDGRVPAILGAAVAVGFVALNLLSYVVGVLLG